MHPTSKIKNEPKSIHEEIIQATKPILDKVSKISTAIDQLNQRVKLMEQRQQPLKLDSIKILDAAAIQDIISEPISGLHEQVRLLQLAIETKDTPNLSIAEFSKRAGRSEKTIRNYLENGKLSFHQVDKGYRITIPVSELEKIKQL